MSVFVYFLVRVVIALVVLLSTIQFSLQFFLKAYANASTPVLRTGCQKLKPNRTHGPNSFMSKTNSPGGFPSLKSVDKIR